MIWLKNFSKKPKKIFTCLGILRSTLMDRYIAKNIERGTSLIWRNMEEIIFIQTSFYTIHGLNF